MQGTNRMLWSVPGADEGPETPDLCRIVVKFPIENKLKFPFSIFLSRTPKPYLYLYIHYIQRYAFWKSIYVIRLSELNQTHTCVRVLCLEKNGVSGLKTYVGFSCCPLGSSSTLTHHVNVIFRLWDIHNTVSIVKKSIYVELRT